MCRPARALAAGCPIPRHDSSSCRRTSLRLPSAPPFVLTTCGTHLVHLGCITAPSGTCASAAGSKCAVPMQDTQAVTSERAGRHGGGACGDDTSPGFRSSWPSSVGGRRCEAVQSVGPEHGSLLSDHVRATHCLPLFGVLNGLWSPSHCRSACIFVCRIGRCYQKTVLRFGV